jgi:opacity protein-like surface antigen
MKKTLIATLVALATAASATEIGVTTTRDYSGAADRTGYGITLGEKYGTMGVTAGVERFVQGSNDQNRYSLVVGNDIAKLGPVTVTPKIGVAYLDNQTTKDGYAMTVGAGASMPVATKVTLGLDVARQIGQNSVSQFNGNRVTVGLKYGF